ncbi:MAG: VOC family protein [Deltaproteobacteria bacterium]|nr:VOC family protein [Deltaproteobacteria bacterium]
MDGSTKGRAGRAASASGSATVSLALLQITLVVRDLARAEAEFADRLGLRVAFRDPSVATWGLENIVLPMGDTFFEILAPTRPDTPGGRHLDRQGDGGYMVILATRELAAHRARVQSLGIRIVLDQETRGHADGQDWAGIHLHPADTGGLMISFDEPDPPDSWVGAGPHWRDFVANDVVEGLVGITLRSDDPARLARRWSEVLGRPLDARVADAAVARIALDRGEIAFRGLEAGEAGEGLAAIRLVASDPRRRGERFALAGVGIELA